MRFFCFFFLRLLSLSESELLLELELLEDDDEDRDLFFRLPFLLELSESFRFFSKLLALDSDFEVDLLSEASDDFLLPFDSELFLLFFFSLLESELLLELELLDDDDDDRDLFFRLPFLVELSESFRFLFSLLAPDSDFDLDL